MGLGASVLFCPQEKVPRRPVLQSTAKSASVVRAFAQFWPGHVFGFFLYSGLVFYNGALDPSPGQGFSAVVEDKNPKRGIRGSDTLTIRTPSGRHHVVVPTAIFKSSQPGQSLPILVRPGYFQWEWFEWMGGGGTSPVNPA